MTNLTWKNSWIHWLKEKLMASVKSLRRMLPRSTDSSKTKMSRDEIELLRKRIDVLESNLSLTLKTVEVLASQCKQSSVLVESLTTNQVNHQAQILEIVNAIDTIAASLGLFSDNAPDDDDTWH